MSSCQDNCDDLKELKKAREEEIKISARAFFLHIAMNAIDIEGINKHFDAALGIDHKSLVCDALKEVIELLKEK